MYIYIYRTIILYHKVQDPGGLVLVVGRRRAVRVRILIAIL